MDRISSTQARSDLHYQYKSQLLQNNIDDRKCLYVYISLYLIEEKAHILNYTIAFTDHV
jgi:hypothetical protein